MNEFVTVGWHVGPETGVDKVETKWLPEVERLLDAGLQVAVINEGRNWGSDQTVDRATLVTVGANGLEGTVAEGLEIASMRDLTGRLPAGHNVPTLNEQAVLEMARDKDTFYKHFTDYTTETFSFRTASEISEALAALPKDREVVIKPADGNGGWGVLSGTKAQVERAYAEQADGKLYVAQTKLNTTELPSSLVGARDIDRERLASSGSKELRLFAANFSMVPVMEVVPEGGRDGAFEYVFVERDSVPEEAFELGKQVMAHLMDITGVRNIVAGIDFVYDSGLSQPFTLMEVNVKQPTLPKVADHRETALTVRHDTADLLIDMTGIAA